MEQKQSNFELWPFFPPDKFALTGLLKWLSFFSMIGAIAALVMLLAETFFPQLDQDPLKPTSLTHEIIRLSLAILISAALFMIALRLRKKLKP